MIKLADDPYDVAVVKCVEKSAPIESLVLSAFNPESNPHVSVTVASAADIRFDVVSVLSVSLLEDVGDVLLNEVVSILFASILEGVVDVVV